MTQRSFRYPESEEFCTNENCTQEICRAETRALADGARKKAVKQARDVTAAERVIADEMMKRRQNSN
jgi:hypothetical protein